MNRQRQLELFVLPALLLTLLLAVMRWFGDEQDLFVHNLWYDKIMHTLGGFVVCAFALWHIANVSVELRRSILRFGLPLVGVVSALFIGSGWEVAEWLFPVMTNYVMQSRLDTAFDLLFSCVGGYIAGKKYNKAWRRHSHETTR